MKPAQTMLNMCLTVFFHAVTTQCQLLLITCKLFLTRYRFKITFSFHGQPANCDFIVKISWEDNDNYDKYYWKFDKTNDDEWEKLINQR